jgi:hypothetical protein
LILWIDLLPERIFKKLNKFGVAQERDFWVDKSAPILRWGKPGGNASGELALGSIDEVQLGSKGKALELGIWLITKKRKMYIEALDTETRDDWADALEMVCAKYRGTRKGNQCLAYSDFSDPSSQIGSSASSPSYKDDDSVDDN